MKIKGLTNSIERLHEIKEVMELLAVQLIVVMVVTAV
jgi:hypothetical protein